MIPAEVVFMASFGGGILTVFLLTVTVDETYGPAAQMAKTLLVVWAIYVAFLAGIMAAGGGAS